MEKKLSQRMNKVKFELIKHSIPPFIQHLIHKDILMSVIQEDD